MRKGSTTIPSSLEFCSKERSFKGDKTEVYKVMMDKEQLLTLFAIRTKDSQIKKVKSLVQKDQWRIWFFTQQVVDLHGCKIVPLV